METKFNFKSQICTSREQSERLLALGLKKETADCHYTRLSRKDDWTAFIGLPHGYHLIPNDYLLPAWSLHRLWELFPKRIRSFQKDYFLTHFDFDGFEKVGYYTVRDGEDVYSDSTINSLIAACSVRERTDIYDALILLLTYDCVRNHFNKEYLV